MIQGLFHSLVCCLRTVNSLFHTTADFLAYHLSYWFFVLRSIAGEGFFFVRRWAELRQGRYLLQGLPALAGVVVVVVVLFSMIVQTRAEVFSRTSKQADEALFLEDLAGAEVAFERLLILDPDQPDGRFGLGRVAALRGDYRRSDGLILPLAPRDRLGHPPAHVWRARQLLSPPHPSPDAVEEAEGHLLRVLQAQPENYEAKGLLIKVYLETNRIDQAEPLAELYGPVWPETSLQLAHILLARGEKEKVERLAERLMVVLKRRLRDYPNVPAIRISLADAHSLQGQYRDAVHVLREGLALDPKGPYPLHLAQVYLRWSDDLASDPTTPPAERQRLVREALQLLRRHNPGTAEMHARFYRLYQVAGDLPEAERHLEKAALEIPELRVELARLYRQRGLTGKAVTTARSALEEFRTRLLANPGDDLARLLAADAALVLGEHQSAINLAFDGWQKARNRAYSVALAKLYLAWWDDELQNLRLTPDDRLGLLRQAMVYDPWNGEALRRLLVAARGNADWSGRARNMVQDLLVQGDAPPLAHLYLGTDYLEQGKHKLALQHLERAYELDSRMVDTANNLAWVLANLDPPDLNRAMDIMDSAVRSQPKSPTLRETRGLILVKLRRWTEAQRDLELCLPFMKDKPQVHEGLAAVYDALGEPDLAGKHRVLAGRGSP
jgi:tetratricopeptide (TPR) repeat protein